MGAAMSAAIFSTNDFRPQDRCAAWGEYVGRAIGRLQARAAGAFDGVVRSVDLGAVKVCNIRVGPLELARTAELARREDRGLVKVVFHLSGRSVLEQDGRQIALSAAEWAIYDTSRPYRMWNCMPVELIAMLMSRDVLRERHIDVTRYGVRPLPSTSGAARILCNFARSLIEDAPAVSRQAESNLGETTLELVLLTLLEHVGEHYALSSGDMLNARIRNYVHRHLRDPRFSIAMIAGAMKCSKRYLHKAFHSPDQVTLSDYIWNQRLDQCRADLMNPRLRHISITEIAFSWGFNSAAHFSRSFKARFGATPSDCRAGAEAVEGASDQHPPIPAASLQAASPHGGQRVNFVFPSG